MPDELRPETAPPISSDAMLVVVVDDEERIRQEGLAMEQLHSVANRGRPDGMGSLPASHTKMTGTGRFVAQFVAQR